MATSTLTSKGQITLPKAVREHLQIEAGDQVEFAIGDDGSVSVTVRRGSASKLFGLLRRTDRAAVPSVREMDEDIAEVVADEDERTRSRR
jgi:AbrB family looped-hinge helix DNA binding protein